MAHTLESIPRRWRSFSAGGAYVLSTERGESKGRLPGTFRWLDDSPALVGTSLGGYRHLSSLKRWLDDRGIDPAGIDPTFIQFVSSPELQAKISSAGRFEISGLFAAFRVKGDDGAYFAFFFDGYVGDPCWYSYCGPSDRRGAVVMIEGHGLRGSPPDPDAFEQSTAVDGMTLVADSFEDFLHRYWIETGGPLGVDL